MKMHKLLCAAIFELTSLHSVSIADETTYSCAFLQSNVTSDFFRDADQIVIDIENQKVDLRIAKTMGTSDPRNWIFETRDEPMGPDVFKVIKIDQSIRGAGFLAGTPHSFDLSEDGTLTWVYLHRTFSQPVWLKWQCST